MKEIKLCSVDGCDSVVDSRGLCGMHYMRMRRENKDMPVNHKAANGSGHICKAGYSMVTHESKPYLEHRLVAEKALGKPLPKGAVVHHIDGNRSNNANNNLLICSREHHNLIHKRQRALEACGHADWEWCQFCKTYDDPKNMRNYGLQSHHKDCLNLYLGSMNAKKKAEKAAAFTTNQ